MELILKEQALLITKDKLHQVINKKFDYPFVVSKEGLYVIAISARAKSEKQVASTSTDDYDLRVEIDGRTFPQLNNTQRYLDSPAAFSGGQLHNLKKTVFFFIQFSEGKHTVSFAPDGTPLLEEITVEFTGASPSKIDLNINQQAEDGDRRPWITFVLVDLPLVSFTAEVTAQYRLRDSDDVKVLVDGTVQEQPQSSLHRFWIFAGSLIKKLSAKTETREKTFHVALSQGLRYIEFWADRTPMLRKAIFDLGEKGANKPTLQGYVYRGVRDDENYSRFDKEIIDAVNHWNDYFSGQQYPPAELLDPNLVKAIVYGETRMGYENRGYPDVMQVGNEDDPALHTLNNDGWVDPRTRKAAKEYEWRNGNVDVVDYHGQANAGTIKASIKWGVRWLYHKAQRIFKEGGEHRRHWKNWKRALKEYGPGTEEYVQKVWRIYKEGIGPHGEVLWKKKKAGFTLVKVILLTCFVMVTIVILFTLFRDQRNLTQEFFLYKEGFQSRLDQVEEITEELARPTPIAVLDSDQYVKFRKSVSEALDDYTREKNVYHYNKQSLFLQNNMLASLRTIRNACEEVQCDTRVAFYPVFPQILSSSDTPEEFARIGNILGEFYTEGWILADIDNDGHNELAFLKSDFMNQEYVELVVIDTLSGKLQSTAHRISDVGYLYSPNSVSLEKPLEDIDLTGDAIPEIVVFAGGSRGGAGIFVFQYKQSLFFQNNHRAIKEIFRNHDLIKAKYVFSDLNSNGVQEIRMQGSALDFREEKRAYEWVQSEGKFSQFEM